MTLNSIHAEFARRALQFHRGEKLENIYLWGLFGWGDISSFIKLGKIIPNPGYTKENKTIWCKPDQEGIKTVRKMIKTYSLEELTSLAGW